MTMRANVGREPEADNPGVNRHPFGVVAVLDPVQATESVATDLHCRIWGSHQQALDVDGVRTAARYQWSMVASNTGGNLIQEGDVISNCRERNGSLPYGAREWRVLGAVPRGAFIRVELDEIT